MQRTAKPLVTGIFTLYLADTGNTAHYNMELNIS